MLKNKKVLFFSPRYFQYEEYVKRGLEKLGAYVEWYDERPNNNFLTKAVVRLNRNLIYNRIETYYSNIFSRLIFEDTEFNYILFLNPETVDSSFIRKMKKRWSNATFILYMWDSFQNKSRSLDLLPYFDSVFSFDRRDALKYNLKHLPLFYIDDYLSDSGIYKYDLFFSGTAHSDRYKLIKKIESNVGPNVNIQSYFFLSSRLLYFINFFLNGNSRMVPYKEVNFKSLTHAENALLMSRSRAILDINHPLQFGLTMRTFESIGVNRKLITTNSDIINYDFYNDNNILIIDRDNPKIDNCFFEKPFIDYSTKIRLKYSLNGWIENLLF
ncbi:hypothetical protein [Arcticibacter tournemirensis]